MFGAFQRQQCASKKPVKQSGFHAFEHTHLGVYCVALFTVVCIFVDSIKGITQKYDVGKKWYYLYGILCCFSYAYLRPLIRRRIGSAREGYLNFYTIYITWLCSAVFYHLPKLKDMGFDLKADLSVIMSVFVGTFLLISVIHGLHRLAVACGWISSFLIEPSNRQTTFWSAIMINSLTLAIACSTYFSFCGNATEATSSTTGIKYLVCQNVLHPIPVDKYPTFRRWVLYSEILDIETFVNGTTGTITASNSMFHASDAISPVLMIWITLLGMFLVNATADHLAVKEIDVSYVSQLRRTLSDSVVVAFLPSKSDFESVSERGRSKSVELKGSFSRETVITSSPRGHHYRRLTVFKEFHNVPEFLPMVPWYCGTSADMIKMSFDLMVSLKLFLGRFDMRTLQAATSDLWSRGPHEGDGFTFFTFRNEEELWMDFFADTGDGGNSTYTVARALASPNLRVVNTLHNSSLGKIITLPRADLLLLGGDLAYPSPSYESYEQRLFAPFNDAMAAPSQTQSQHVHNKTSIPESSKNRRPQCFAIPGNHDWHDGLEIFMQCILHRGWLGGWALPQEKSYFAIALPHDWWIFAADLALVWDIDMCQYQYFSKVIEKYLKPESQVIIMTHEPIWMEDWLTCNPDSTAPNLRDLIRSHLKGRARVYIAGDLHFYMRHQLTKNTSEAEGSESEDATTLDPEHLIVQGLGGAFLHPTHIFSGAKLPAKMFPNEKEIGEYVCQKAYPSPGKSLELTKYNLFRFRSMNTKFDLVGALWYFLLVGSVIPRCRDTITILEAPSFSSVLSAFCRCFQQTIIDIFSQSYISLAALIVLYVGTFLFAVKGSVGCALAQPFDAIHAKESQWLNGFSPKFRRAAERGFRARTGGYGICAFFAFFHTLAHLTMAIALMLILEIGFFICIKYHILGSAGYHSLFLWFKSFLDEHFPDPMGVRVFLERFSFELYPRLLKYFMAVFDVPEAVAVARIRICATEPFVLTRIQTIGYYLGMLAYYWLLASPAMGLVFGIYLYVTCSFYHIHYDEAFSALRIQHFKGFSRMRICKNGNLELFSVAVDRVAEQWIEDPYWRGPAGGLNAENASHLAEYPSRWIPDTENISRSRSMADLQFKMIDHLIIPKKRSHSEANP